MTSAFSGRQGPRLGRRFAGHDPRSRRYGVRPLLAATEVERQPTVWRLPSGSYPLDQGAEGACTGYGMAHELAAGPVVLPGMDDGAARARYARNRQVDAELGNHWADGASVLATMRAAQADGLISGYRWAFGADDVVDTLCSVGPVCLGIDWYGDMYETGPGGRVLVSGDLVGGHFITLVGYDVHRHWGPCVLWLNSWGSAYGIGEPRAGVTSGVGWLTVADLGRLLAANGEAVVPADFFAGLPTPDVEQPVLPAPEPEPVPVPVPVPAPAPEPEPQPWQPPPGMTWWRWLLWVLLRAGRR